MRASPSAKAVCFGPFMLDLRAGELCKDGRKIRLQEQPLQVLRMLIEHAGEVVTREEIKQKLWPNDTVVEFDHSINAAIKKLRLALGESAEEPQYVETVARRGYRLLVPVQWEEADLGGAVAVAAPAVDHAQDESAARNLSGRSEEHTSELQSPYDLVCRLLLEKKKYKHKKNITQIII